MIKKGVVPLLLMALAIPSVCPVEAEAAGGYYIEPMLMTSSQILNAIGLEFSPIFLRDEPARSSLPTQTFMGFSIQGAVTKNSSVEIAVGRVKRSMIPMLNDPFQRINFELKSRTGGQNFWYLFYFDFDWGRTDYGITTYNRGAFSLGQNIGFRVGPVIIEASLGLVDIIIPDLPDTDAWSDTVSFEIPLAVRVACNITKRNALDLEMRFPVIVGPLKDIGVKVPVDMALGYQYIIGNSWLLKGALFWAVNEYNVGREEVGMILSAKWVFF